jgi:hypothetical protein
LRLGATDKQGNRKGRSRSAKRGKHAGHPASQLGTPISRACFE